MNSTNQLWLEIDDPTMSSEELVALIAARTAARAEAVGQLIMPQLPGFGVVAPPQAREENGRFSPLHHHLTQLSTLPPPETTPILATSPATQLPILGKLWQFIRRQAHQLTLFYINRFVAYDSQRQTQLLNTLHELAQLVQMQQDEIARLQKLLEADKEQ